MDILKGGNLLVAFVAELAMLAAFVVWALGLDQAGWLKWLIAVVAVVVAATAWGIFAAPKSGMRLGEPWLTVFKVAMFALAVLALQAAGRTEWAVVLGVVAAANLVLMHAWGQA
ncbi:hypothetical protein GCM10011321_02130 [Youhaiella tibetensis]|uniref:DUF2568 domain-containing protein n=1 Tax=Paradevosia tibetensis TaxID=1447062 RepID=UPI001479124E|nr:DUF2568 domain-containing protein [Youhaiella tibetensis]GGF13727.1 hypothetical protein GCM10011321_02130 [Youhaiella tibetensis]